MTEEAKKLYELDKQIISDKKLSEVTGLSIKKIRNLRRYYGWRKNLLIKNITKELLYQKYWVEGLSTTQLAKFFGRTHRSVGLWLKRFGIKAKTMGNYKGRSFHTDESKRKLSIASSGKNNPAYIDGRTDLRHRIYRTPEYKNWVLNVFKRDKFTCIECGYDKGHTIQAHHKTPFSVLIQKYNIKTVKDARDCFDFWDVSNGLTLCKDCHKKTDSYGNNKIVSLYSNVWQTQQ